MLLATPAAQASHWNVTVTDKGGSNATFKGISHPWVPPTAPGNNTIAFSAYAADTIDGPDDNRDTHSAVTLNVTVTLTWVADPAGDPAPPTVWVVENASATAGAAGTGAAATANDGLSADPYVNTPTNPDQDSATMSTPSGLPGGGRLQKLTVSGGVATFDRNLTASGTSTYSSTDSFPGTQSASASDTVTIHAQPYNWHITSVNNNGDGSLSFYYDWQSTSGSKADLTSCYIHEWVTYPGPQGTALAPLVYTMPAPFSGGLWNPTVLPGTGQNGQPATDPNGGTDHQGVPALSPPPYVSGGFTATQAYEFDDITTGETNVIVPGPDSGPLSIVRSVYTLDNVIWLYSLTKSGHTVTTSI